LSILFYETARARVRLSNFANSNISAAVRMSTGTLGLSADLAEGLISTCLRRRLI
jgi:hypothetical protein